MASYNDYLKELGHTAENVAMMVEPLKNAIKALQKDIEKKKKESYELSEDIKKLSNNKIKLKKELSAEG